MYKWAPATYCWGNPAIDWHSVQGGVAVLLGMLHDIKETGISSGHLGLWFMYAFTLPNRGVACDFEDVRMRAYI